MLRGSGGRRRLADIRVVCHVVWFVAAEFSGLAMLGKADGRADANRR